jgi:AraC-like DNA-binding protein
VFNGDCESDCCRVAARAGFSDQSQFSYHYKRLVRVTPGQFRTRARIA